MFICQRTSRTSSRIVGESKKRNQIRKKEKKVRNQSVFKNLQLRIKTIHSTMTSTERMRRKDEEYEMQLFAFHSRAVYASLFDIVHEQIRTNCIKMSDTLKEKHNFSTEQLTELDNNVMELIHAYNNAVIPSLQNMENLVIKFIAVPPNVLLEEDKSQIKQYTDEEYEQLERKLEILQKRAKKAKQLVAAFESELEVLKLIDSRQKDTGKLCEIIENASHRDIEKSMIESVENYKELQTQTDPFFESDKTKYNSIENLK